MMRSIQIPLVALVAVLAGPAAAQKGKGGPAPACGLKALPMAVGNTWTYRSGSQQVVVKVLSVEPGKDHAGKAATTIVTEETYQDRTVTATSTCTAAGGLVVSLDSFFFSGEPGGAAGATMTVTSRDKATLLPDAQLITDQGWVEIAHADIVRTDAAGAGAVHLPAKIEVERHISIKGDEKLMIGMGQFATQKVYFELRGRGIVEDQTVEIPIKRPAMMWLSRGVGYVKIEDAFDKTWELMDTNVVPK